jgi:hypothetical protein
MDPKGKKPPMPEGVGMPSKLQQVTERMTAGMQELNPMAMCQAMMTSVGAAAEMAAYATPEVRTLFEEWARSVEDEVLAVLKARGPLDLAGLAGALKISPESALYFLGKLVRDGRASISQVQAVDTGRSA